MKCDFDHMKGPGSTSHDATNAAKRGLNEALRTGENLKNQATSSAENVPFI